jgi:hypothetical protein
MKKVFLSGPVTGLDYDQVVNNFKAAELKLMDKGYQVLSPVNFVPPGEDWHKAMRRCIRILSVCDAIYVLEGAECSLGATLEREIAIALEFEIMFEGID